MSNTPRARMAESDSRTSALAEALAAQLIAGARLKNLVNQRVPVLIAHSSTSGSGCSRSTLEARGARKPSAAWRT